MSNVWTIGWLAGPSFCQVICVFSLTPCGCLLGPGLVGRDRGLDRDLRRHGRFGDRGGEAERQEWRGMRRLRACAWSDLPVRFAPSRLRHTLAESSTNMNTLFLSVTAPRCHRALAGGPLLFGNARVYTARAAGGRARHPADRLGPGRLSRRRSVFVHADPRSTRSRGAAARTHAPPPRAAPRSRPGAHLGGCRHSPPCSSSPAIVVYLATRAATTTTGSTSSTPASSSTATSCGSAAPRPARSRRSG